VAFLTTILFNYPALFSLLLCIKWGHKFSMTSRIVIPLIINMIALVVILVVTAPSVGVPLNVSFGILLACCFVCGTASAVLTASSFAWVAMFPGIYTTAVMSGNGLSGVVIGFLRIITLWDFPNDAQTSAIIYFAIAAFGLLFCIISYLYSRKLPFVNYYVDKNRLASIQTEEKLPLLKTDNMIMTYNTVKRVSLWVVMKKIWLEAWNVFFNFFVTLCLFPGLIVQIPNYREDLNTWFIVLLIFTFQVGDFIGRTIPRWIIMFRKEHLWIPILLRVVFFALFIICIDPISKPVIREDAFPFIIMGLFAVSNGYLGTLAMVYGPSRVDPEELQVAGSTMAFFLNLGIFLGVQVALGIAYPVVGIRALPQFSCTPPPPSM